MHLWCRDRRWGPVPAPGKRCSTQNFRDRRSKEFETGMKGMKGMGFGASRGVQALIQPVMHSDGRRWAPALRMRPSSPPAQRARGASATRAQGTVGLVPQAPRPRSPGPGPEGLREAIRAAGPSPLITVHHRLIKYFRLLGCRRGSDGPTKNLQPRSRPPAPRWAEWPYPRRAGGLEGQSEADPGFLITVHPLHPCSKAF